MVGDKNANDEAVNWVCPRCCGDLVAEESGYRCLADDLLFMRRDGIWRFLLPEREAFFKGFVDRYQVVREDEGWGLDEGAYYRALPFDDLSGRHGDIWRIRARSYEMLLSGVIEPLAAERDRALRILDLGAGNGWLSYRLAQKGHRALAVDLLDNVYDGLGAYVHYDVAFEPLQAEFDRLPVDDAQADMVIYNGALHYSADYAQTLAEGLRVLQPAGRLVVLDSPIYRDASSGDKMLQERQERFGEHYGFSEPSLPSEGYLTFARLDSLASAFGLRWRFLKPEYGWRWTARVWLARMRSRREPATFLVVVGRRM
ncbi:MAG TPA: class I SAM-dependent methyltransferase [Anaerolineae bacterium]|jgi:SAM-dependent methyltransferase|nr:class I SAM-dependent methyltransferase [Anaerolineae bacterium]